MTTQNDLYTLAYFSRNAIEEAGGDLTIEIRNILEIARQRNSEANVTGALMFSSGCFAQVLEGPLDAVEIIFESILRDRRHHRIAVLYLKPTESRNFSDWSMAFAGRPAKETISLDIPGLLNSPDEIDGDRVGGELVVVLRDLIEKYETVPL